MENNVRIINIYSIGDGASKTLILFSNGRCMLSDYGNCWKPIKKKEIRYIVTGDWDITQRDTRLILNFDMYHNYLVLGLYLQPQSKCYIFSKNKCGDKYKYENNILNKEVIRSDFFEISEKIFTDAFINFENKQKELKENLDHKIDQDIKLIKNFMSFMKPKYLTYQGIIDFLWIGIMLGGSGLSLIISQYNALASIILLVVSWISLFALPWRKILKKLNGYLYSSILSEDEVEHNIYTSKEILFRYISDKNFSI